MEITTADEATGDTESASVPEKSTRSEGENAADKRNEVEAGDGGVEEVDASQQAESSAEDAERFRKEAEVWYDRFVRLQADFDNYRKRTAQEREEWVRSASRRLVEKLLPVVDHFELAAASSRQNRDFDALAKGVDMILRQLEQLLREEGVEPIETVGRPFDPELHEAIMRVDSAEHGEGVVVEEVRRGYRMHGKVLRPALVKVSQ
ncbi:MAG: nucleotide exchange factor GrpE [Candidatus Reconcilbacillus cellulovorans]|uniref:Protein GrpE n=1 Tax=Candidatus Reconcilbacillus cellulovorans TaxID=1906605 RepID=A0A2A6DX81_9BACL|nr:MAG: nucleotide exchange factor GrpE [Candidatus Reconcilbacillus cellulovorans]